MIRSSALEPGGGREHASGDMRELPQRVSLVNQVAAILERDIAKGAWHEWLPNERALCEHLQVSRNTLRAALDHLKARKIVKAMHPRGTRIIAAPPAAAPEKQTKVIGLLSPGPIDLMRPNVALIIDQLRAQLAELGYRLHLHHGTRYFTSRSGAALQKLVDSHPHDCWVLVLANEPVKRWFYRAGVKCVVSGSCTEDVRLPFVDLDYRALGRHAVGRMVAAKHQRLALLCEKSERTGLIDCARGFCEGLALATAANPAVEGRVMQYLPSSQGLINGIEGLLRSNRPPTALLVTNPHHFLLALTYLNQTGRTVPREVSLVSTDDDPYLSFIYPTPTRYGFNAHLFAKRLFRLIQQRSLDQVIRKASVRIMPIFAKGATLVPCSAPSDS